MIIPKMEEQNRPLNHFFHHRETYVYSLEIHNIQFDTCHSTFLPHTADMGIARLRLHTPGFLYR